MMQALMRIFVRVDWVRDYTPRAAEILAEGIQNTIPEWDRLERQAKVEYQRQRLAAFWS